MNYSVPIPYVAQHPYSKRRDKYIAKYTGIAPAEQQHPVHIASRSKSHLCQS